MTIFKKPCIENQLRIKNVTTYCYNKKSSATNSFGLKDGLLAVCIKGRCIQLYTIDENAYSINLYKEINLPELCLQIESNQNHLCLACENGYFVIDIKNSKIQKLFTYELESMKFKPFIANHVEGEFLLNSAGRLGVFGAFDGQSNRPPLKWCDDCQKFRIASPYVLCINNESIHVYSLIDSKLKQVISFSQTREFEYVDEENIFIITTPVKMYFINAVSASSQVEQLLALKKVDEAISLFECLNTNLTDIEYEEKFKIVKTKAGFVELTENRNYEKTKKLFMEANLDFKQMVKLIPDLITYTDENDSNEYANFIQDFHESMKTDQNSNEILTKVKEIIIDCMFKTKQVKTSEFIAVLFKLCVECQPDQLADKDFIVQLPLKFCQQNLEILYDHKRHHSIALIYHLLNKNEDAFEIWKNLCDGNLTDEYFPGFDFVLKQLACLKDHQLLLGYLDWAMCKDETKAIEIFIKRPKDELASERLRPDLIIDRLANYEVALVIFLEFLVFNKSIMKEKYTTQLIGVYLENVISLIKQTNETRTSSWTSDLDNARKKLQDLLQSSNNYRVQLILGRIKEFEKYLQKECAILYGKIEEHEKALKIFVYTLQDYTAATEYCLNNSKDSSKLRKKLFHILFTVLMNPAYSDRDKLLKPTLELLNSHLSSNFDIPKLIEIIPNNWSLKITSNFLLNVLQSNLSLKNKYSVEKNMSSNLKFSLQQVTYDLRKEQLYIDDDTQCCKCHKTFESSIFIRQPNGKFSHLTCARMNY